ncbi:MAG: hypothetical protein GC137_08220 [Alphaproteobacteria bacterium]|nr:hypothetical protein [Alphaproteobacteria bacterium]
MGIYGPPAPASAFPPPDPIYGPVLPKDPRDPNETIRLILNQPLFRMDREIQLYFDTQRGMDPDRMFRGRSMFGGNGDDQSSLDIADILDSGDDQVIVDFLEETQNHHDVVLKDQVSEVLEPVSVVVVGQLSEVVDVPSVDISPDVVL